MADIQDHSTRHLERSRVAGQPQDLLAYVRALRPHHWAKNALIFLPLLLAHQLLNPYLVWWSLLAFGSFCMAASATYLINDLVDIESDRKHPVKRFRPLASGAMKPAHAMAMVPALFAGSIGLSLMMPEPKWFLAALATYLVLGQIYVFYLKRKLLVDVLALAALHMLRILAGNAATGIALSSWLLAFAMFLFFSLALLKRYAELRDTGDDVGLRGVGRGYQAGDLETLSQMGISSAVVSALILALYVDSKAVSGLYTYPQLIWLLCPIVLYVMARVWVLARRGQLPDDPLMFMITDWRSQLMGVAAGAVLIAATYL
ncbi:MAG: UbiA family prenyltransferase [Hyphomicrobiales bacterium]|nr:UbiA family prenyltransferase [Hyphomicrobiales bacterium]